MPETSPPPQITVAICTHNRARFVRPAIESVLPQIRDGVELLVIDNASTDATPEVLRELAGRYSNLRACREDRKGIPHAHNAAIREARGQWVLFFDDDEIAPPDWIANYQNFFARHQDSRVGCVGAGYEPVFESKPPHWFNIARARYFEGDQDKLLKGPAFPWCGNCAYLRRAVIEQGGFCTDLIRTDETDLSMRLTAAGYEVWWLAGNAIQHVLPGTRLTPRSYARLGFIEGRDYGRLRLRHLPKSAHAPYRFGRIIFAPIYGLWLLIMTALTLPFKKGQTASRHFYRSMRAFGMAWQLLCDIGRKEFTDDPKRVS